MRGRVNPLDLEAKLRQRTIGLKAATVGAKRATGAPVVVDLDPTSYCDLACPECISTTVLNKSKLGADRLLKLCAEIAEAGVLGVIFIGGGEPLVHRSTPAAMEMLCDAGVRVGVVTNGTHLDRVPASLFPRLAWVRVSVDAGCASTFDLVRPSRGRSAFPKVLEGIRRAVDCGTPIVGYSFVVLHNPASGSHTNIADIPLAAETARELGCSYLELKAQLAHDHYVVTPSTAALAEIATALSRAERYASSEFTVLQSSSLRQMLAQASPTEPKAYTWCPSAHLRTLVTPTGMYVCAYHRGNGQFKIGDVGNQSFAEAWAAADRAKVNPSRDCGFHCARDGINRRCLDESRREELRTASAPDVDPFL